MTGKIVICPECGEKDVSFFYSTEYTHIYCQSKTRDPDKICPSLGKYCFKTYHHSDLNYPNIIRKDKWILNGSKSKEASIEYHKL